MSLRARAYTPADREGFNRVRSRVYRGGEPVRSDEVILAEDGFGTVVEACGEIVGAATGLDFTCNFHGQRARCVGVAAVGVVPEARRGGAGQELMRFSNEHYRELGFEIASLYPFRGGFYRRFGYEYAGFRQLITITPNLLPAISDPLPIRELQVSDVADLHSVYESYAGRYNGMNYRTDLQWNRALGMETPFTIYAAGDPIEAYALVRLDGTFWVKQAVREFVWRTRNGYESILSLFAGICMNKTELSWWEPQNGPFWLNHLEQQANYKLDGLMMWRILDVPKVLQKIRPETNVEFQFECIDPSMPANKGIWKVMAGPAGSQVEQGTAADFRIEIGALSQAALGDPSLASLVDAGLVDVLNPDGVKHALSFFRPHPVYCLDFF